MTPSWRDITISKPLPGQRRLMDPVDYARMRMSQNVMASQSECAYQRQTGRTFRMLLSALEIAESKKSVLIVSHTAAHCNYLCELAQDWVDQLCMAVSATKGSGSQGKHIMSKSGGKPLLSFIPADFSISPGFAYDAALFDNNITDICCANMKALKGRTTQFEELVMKVMSMCSNDVIHQEPRASDGSLWSDGDLFKLSGADAVGTLLSVDRVAGIPIGLKVLYDQNILYFPWEASNVFQKVASLS